MCPFLFTCLNSFFTCFNKLHVYINDLFPSNLKLNFPTYGENTIHRPIYSTNILCSHSCLTPVVQSLTLRMFSHGTCLGSCRPIYTVYTNVLCSHSCHTPVVQSLTLKNINVPTWNLALGDEAVHVLELTELRSVRNSVSPRSYVASQTQAFSGSPAWLQN